MSDLLTEDLTEDLPPMNFVSLEPIRARFLHLEAVGSITRGDVARALGWLRSAPPSQRAGGRCTMVDTGRVSRVLGIKGERPQQSVCYDTAVKLCRVLSMDPVDAGV